MEKIRYQPAVVISGASTGIGESTALELARRGFLVFAGVRTEEAAERLKSRSQGNLVPLRLDITDASQIAKAGELVREKTQEAGLLGLVNNAGIAMSCPMEVIPLNDFRRQLEVNLVGHLAMIQTFLPLLRKRPGRIVNITSINGSMATPYLGPYAASKFALEAISDSLRVELRHWGIKVIVVAPGAVKTPIWNKSADSAEAMSKTVSTESVRPYCDDLEIWRKTAQEAERNGDPVETVVEKITIALTSPQPRSRYYLHFSQRFLCRGFKVVPECIRDWFICRGMGFHKRK
jgi:NAD(P)-dependent dehydrogenase (short-subunit alcohol dehydrogenase family)